MDPLKGKRPTTITARQLASPANPDKHKVRGLSSKIFRDSLDGFGKKVFTRFTMKIRFFHIIQTAANTAAAYELWADGEGGYSVNDSWHLARGCDREEAISHLANRWQVFKANYAPRARVRDLSDANWSGNEFPALLEVNCLAFAEVRNGGEE